MPWFQVDDALPANSKIRRLIETNPANALPAVGLWTLAGASAQAGLTDGVVTEGDLVRLTLDRNKARRLAGVLVDAGLWHAAGHSCSHCPPVDRGAYVFHQWFQCGYEASEAVKIKRARDKEVKNPRITDAVRVRDGDECRYCGRTVDWKDRKSDKGGSYDHVIPGLAKGAENLVVACLRCNRAKGQRTPEQASMTLRPTPGSSE